MRNPHPRVRWFPSRLDPSPGAGSARPRAYARNRRLLQLGALGLATAWLALAGAAAVNAHASDGLPRRNPLEGAEPCAIERFAAPSDAPVAGFEVASCVALDGARRLCKVRSIDEGPGSLIFFEGGAERWRWPAEGNLGATADFALYRVPGASGATSWVIANHRSSSNGLGVETSDLLYLAAFETGARPLAFTVEDFGPSAFVRLPGRRACGVLASEWFPAEDRKRGPGTYYGATVFQPVAGYLVPLAEGGAVARRLLGSFDAERAEDLWGGPEKPWPLGDPLKWLASPRAELRSNPSAALPVARCEAGTITAAAYDDATRPPLVTVALASGGEIHARERYFPPSSCAPGAATRELPIGRIGDQAHRVLFPQSYRPADPGALVGRTATLITYRDDAASVSSCPPRILWVGDANEVTR